MLEAREMERGETEASMRQDLVLRTQKWEQVGWNVWMGAGRVGAAEPMGR